MEVQLELLRRNFQSDPEKMEEDKRRSSVTSVRENNSLERK